MRVGKTIKVEEDVPMPVRATPYKTFIIAPDYTRHKELVLVKAKKPVEEKSESEGIEDDKPRCPFCDHILTKEMTPSGLKYLCIKHGYFDLDDLEGKKRGI